MIKHKIEKIFKENPETRIVFFWDPDRVHEEEAEELAGDDMIVIKPGAACFGLTYKLEYQIPEKKVLLYHTSSKPTGDEWEDYPLLALYSANQELRLDEVAEIMDKYSLQPQQEQLVRQYKDVLKSKNNQEKLAKILDTVNFTKANLSEGLISIALDFSTVVNKEYSLIKLFTYLLQPEKLQLSLDRIHRYGLEDLVLSWLNDITGKNQPKLDKASIQASLNRFKYNLIMRNITEMLPQDNYAGMKVQNSYVLNHIYALIKDWETHRHLSDKIQPVLENAGKNIKEQKLIEVYGVNADFAYYTNTMTDSIVRDALARLDNNPAVIRDEIKPWTERQDVSEINSLCFKYIFFAASMRSVLEHYPNLKFDSPNAYLENYTRDLYKVDYYYRKAISISNALTEKDAEYQELSASLESINQVYDRFLIDLNVGWQQIMQDNEFDFSLLRMTNQSSFFEHYLEDFDAKHAVIISDAFRYEAGFELYETLITDNKNETSLDGMITSVPSDTNQGMANLLPGKELNVKETEHGPAYLKDGMSTQGMQNRKKILEAGKPSSSAIHLNELLNYSEKEGREYFKQHKCVYIFHDWIDAVGDSAKTEKGTIAAVSKAIDEIKRMLKKLYNWNVLHAFITADHGFIYNQVALNDASRQDYPEAESVIQKHTRFMIGKRIATSHGYVFPLNHTSQAESDFDVALPSAINRYRKQGNIGVRFTHGGASLQEIIIPVIRYYRKKERFAEKVSIKRLDSQKRITTGSIKISIFQDQPVSNQYKPMEVVIGLYDKQGNQLSNEEVVAMDATSENPKDRIREVILTLNTKSNDENLAYLRAFDAEMKDRLNPVGIDEKLIISRTTQTDFEEL